MDPTQRSPNRLLANLSSGDFDLIAAHLRTTELVQAMELVAAGDELADAYFPHSGVLSLVIRMSNGEATEIAMIGRGSVFGASAALAGSVALTAVIAQSSGSCSVLSIKRLQEAVEQSSTLRTTLLRHEQAIFAQAKQSVACTTSHSSQARLARWLLRARDASRSDEFQCTQEFLGQMLGLNRNTISRIASDFQDKGLLKFCRGRLVIVDVPRLNSVACECYATVRDELDELKRNPLN